MAACSDSLKASLSNLALLTFPKVVANPQRLFGFVEAVGGKAELLEVGMLLYHTGQPRGDTFRCSICAVSCGRLHCLQLVL